MKGGKEQKKEKKKKNTYVLINLRYKKKQPNLTLQVTKVINHLPLTRHVSVNSPASFWKTMQKCYTPLLKCLYIKIIMIPCNYVKEVPSIWFLLSSFQTCFQCLGLHHYSSNNFYKSTDPDPRTTRSLNLLFQPQHHLYTFQFFLTALLLVSPSMFWQVKWNIWKQSEVNIRPNRLNTKNTENNRITLDSSFTWSTIIFLEVIQGLLV